MKKIDLLLLRSFVAPFVVTFFIALFVLIMQTLWLYIDDIAGKGAGLFVIIEFLIYLSVSLIPMALPIAVLISSVMLLGGMAEHYELSSFKSAGVSLWRVMQPLVFLSVLISIGSFFISNNLIPVSNLKFKSRLYDIRRQKPTLSLEEGLFNDDFQGYALRIGKKGSDDRSISDVLLYDHRDATKGRLTQVTADHGEMYASEDGRYFVLELRDGHQYAEGESKKKASNTKSYPFIRTNFSEWHKVFDLSEFDLNRTDEELFKSHHSMLSSRQLLTAIDSIENKARQRREDLARTTSNFFYFEKEKLVAMEREKSRQENQQRRENKAAKPDQAADSSKIDTRGKNTVSDLPRARKVNVPKLNQGRQPLPIKIDRPLDTYASFLQVFESKEHKRLLDKAKASARSIKTQAESALRSGGRTRESRVKHIYTFHNKFSMAAACLIFLFIGAPMGAIVRKGGFGYPIIVAVSFFMLFVVLTVASKKIAETFVLDPVLAAWLPCLVLLPLGLYLTYQAMNDARVINVQWFQRLLPGRKKPPVDDLDERLDAMDNLNDQAKSILRNVLRSNRDSESDTPG